MFASLKGRFIFSRGGESATLESTNIRSEEDVSNLEPYKLSTVPEGSEEDLSKSALSLISEASADGALYNSSHKLAFRAGVEALVKEGEKNCQLYFTCCHCDSSHSSGFTFIFVMI